ncbi:MAG: hypothetical protein HYR66_05570 [Sphingobacteriales bacterium]|nr:hypothetical protein [Sphingobacteriales bacterium]MBI3719910.1 hypothetical protein [Sphingobacteriales bacterium]
MGFNDIEMSPVLLTELYKNSLVQLDDVQMAKPATPSSTPALKYLGENKKGILILVNDEQAPFLNENAFNLLLNILNACKLNMGDVGLINKINLAVTVTDVIQQLSIKTVLLFGIEAREMNLPIDFPHYQVQQHGNITYLTSNDFETLEADKQQKGKLWLCLKKIFDV